MARWARRWPRAAGPMLFHWAELEQIAFADASQLASGDETALLLPIPLVLSFDPEKRFTQYFAVLYPYELRIFDLPFTVYF